MEQKSEPLELRQFKTLLRDWIEARLPANLRDLDSSFPRLESELVSVLKGADLIGSQDRVGIESVELSRLTEFPEVVTVKASIDVPCGIDTSVYVYRFGANSRTRLLAADGKRDWGDELTDVQFSAPDPSGNRVMYASWLGVQCASVWNVLDYRLYRIAPGSDHADPIFSGTHSFTIDNDAGIKLTADELLMELTAEGLEAGFRRTYVLRYRIDASGVTRIDPVALQAQDFVHEWIDQPWSEMKSRSAPSLAKWHALLHSDNQLFFGHYDFAQPCSKRPGYTQVAVEVEPRTVYFLVRDKGGHSYDMSDVRYDRQSGCPGETDVELIKQPSLLGKQ
jgi:hypothetical protein